MLLVLQTGALIIRTEMGVIRAEPCEIVVVPRGIKFTVDIEENEGKEGSTAFCRGYVLEVFNGHFELPNLGPIGANGMANPRDFLTPAAAYEDVDLAPDGSAGCYQIVQKFMNKLFETRVPFSPYDVVAWHGNYAPFKYDLRAYCCMNTGTCGAVRCG
jgi:homogentisate 1,2-dioxygenase